MHIGTNQRIGGLVMRYGSRSQLALLDCTSSRRSTVMRALPWRMERMDTRNGCAHRSLAVQSTAHANACCKRAIGTIRRAYSDRLVPLHECHLRGILREWMPHCNRGLSRTGLGPGTSPALIQPVPTGHRLPTGCRVSATPVLNGLHHEHPSSASRMIPRCARTSRLRRTAAAPAPVPRANPITRSQVSDGGLCEHRSAACRAAGTCRT